jgi:hypothetical protein
MDKPVGKTFIRGHVLSLAVGLIVLYWFLEAAMHVLVFGEPSVKKAFFPTDLDELWMRGLICALFLGFGFYAKSILGSLKNALELLGESERKCRGLEEELRKTHEMLRRITSGRSAGENTKKE